MVATNILEKKVFFIYPHSVIQTKLIQELIDREYEIYFINDHQKIESICEYYTSPLIYINIDEGLEESQWEKLIESLMEKDSSNHARIGIVTYNDNADLARKYLMDLMLPCGFIKLKIGVNDSTDIIIKTLDANEVKGNRKYIRTRCNSEEASFNTSILGNIHNGCIVDISSVGMTVTFDDNLELVKNSYLKDIQLKLRGILLKVSAIIIGFRELDGEKKLFLLLFDQSITNLTRSKIRSFISKTLQHNMEKKLNIK